MKMLPTALFILMVLLFGSASPSQAGPSACYRYAFVTVKVESHLAGPMGTQKKTWNAFTADTCGGPRVRLTDDLKATNSLLPLDAWGNGLDDSKIAFFSSDRETGALAFSFHFLGEGGGKAGDSLRGEIASTTSYAPFLPYGGLAFGPDGRMAFSALLKKSDGGSSLSIISEAGELFSMDVPSALPGNGITLDWSPVTDAARAFYGKIIFSKPDSTLHVLDVQTKETYPLTESLGGAVLQGQFPAISLDEKLVFIRQTDGKNQIWTCDLGVSTNGSSYHCESLRSLALEGNQFSPSWSPDGRKIFFTSCTSGEACYAFMANVDGTDAVQLTNDDEPGIMPVCLPARMSVPRKEESSLSSLMDPIDYERVTPIKIPRPVNVGGGVVKGVDILGKVDGGGPDGQKITGSSKRETGGDGGLVLPSHKQFDMSVVKKPGANAESDHPQDRVTGAGAFSAGGEVSSDGQTRDTAGNYGKAPGDHTNQRGTPQAVESGSGSGSKEPTAGRDSSGKESSSAGAATSTGASFPKVVDVAVDSGSPAINGGNFLGSWLEKKPEQPGLGNPGTLSANPWDLVLGKRIKTPNPMADDHPQGGGQPTNADMKIINKAVSQGSPVPKVNPPAALVGTSDPEKEAKTYGGKTITLDPEAAKKIIEEQTINNSQGANVNPE